MSSDLDDIVSVYNLGMKKRTPLCLMLSLLLSLLAGCARTTTPDENTQVKQAVAATLAAIPSPTAPPLSTPYPSPTPFSLAGLFCEYQFCIGHPVEMAFFDVSAQQNPAAPSTYSQGLLAAFNANLFIQVMWQTAPGASDPKFLLDTIIDPQIDTRDGTMDVMLVRNMNVMYIKLTSAATPVLPHGGAGAWVCGDRVFAWKVYTPGTENARPLFDEALARFTCGK
ncbi:MAG: hypothetical protein QY332_19300 [Anaerolineales bacterium]|nr:MAG: hypothetical protein QY332_19300 [Anaerolineales bacterium]